MAKLRNHILGITVISAGACAALPFRNEAVDLPGNPATDVPLQHDEMPREQLQLNLSIAASPPQPTEVPELNSQPATLERSTTNTVVLETSPVSINDPPKIASRFEPFVATFPAETQKSTPSRSPMIIDRLHRIVDGDTLESLAEKYLGDAERWREILDQNKSLLTSRDLLPIGDNLRIQGERRLPVVLVTEQATNTPSNNLVPISRD